MKERLHCSPPAEVFKLLLLFFFSFSFCNTVRKKESWPLFGGWFFFLADLGMS